MASATYAIFLVMNSISEEEERVRAVLSKGRNFFKQSSETSASLVALITHDLATPLMVIRHRITQLKTASDMERSKILEQLEKSVEQMEGLIQDVKLMRAHQGGKILLELVSVKILDVVRDAITDLQIKADKKSIILNLHIDDAVTDSDTVLADPHTLRTSVVENILSNAIKFSPENSYINIKVYKQDLQIIIEIQDFGMGISSEIKKSLFDFTSPTTHKGTCGEMGTGFGLPLVKLFMDKFQGQIKILSGDEIGGIGTIVTLSLKPFTK